jgi:hypothetical protein
MKIAAAIVLGVPLLLAAIFGLHEGKFWNAYYAMPNTMERAILLGSIAMRFIEKNQERKDVFMALMREGVADIIEEKTGTRPIWPDGPQPAPERERAGHG